METSLSFWLIPVVAAVVGWGTNWLALKMTFYPVEFVGWYVFGWQGIIPSKAPKLAHNVMDLVTSRLMDLEVLFEQLDPKAIAKEMEPEMESLARNSVNQSMEKQVPMLWAVLPKKKKESIYLKAKKEFPQIVEDIFTQIKANIHEVFDAEEMIQEALLRDKALLNRVFLKCGAKEFLFIERSGIYFGFLFGCIQMFIWNSFSYWWILPLGGLIVGFATNWLALKLIFRPLKPYKIGAYTLQGMFIKRQAEVADVYAQIFADEILTPEKIFNHVIKNQGGDRLIELTQAHLENTFDDVAGTSDRIVLKLLAGSEKYFKIRDLVVAELVSAIPYSVKTKINSPVFKIDFKSNLENNMNALSAHEFEGALHPIFQEEEWILILIGALLGAGAGFLQLIFLL